MDAMRDFGALIFVLIVVFILWLLFAPKDNPDITKGPFIEPVGTFGTGEVYGPTGTIDDIIEDVPTGWNLFETQTFYIALPPNWTFREFTTQEENIFAGEFRTQNMALSYEYSRFASPLATEGDSRYNITEERIGGRNATLVRSISEIGVTGAYFPAVRQDNRLSISGFNLTEEQKNLAISVFRTIRFK